MKNLWKPFVFLLFCSSLANLSHGAMSGATKKKSTLKFPSRILELSIAGSFISFQQSNSFELGLTSKKSHNKKPYLTYLGIFAQNIRSVYKFELSTFSTAALGFRLGVGIPIRIFKHSIAMFTNLAYASTSTQKDPWWGNPKNNLNQDPLYIFSVGLKYVNKKYTLFFRQDLNSYNSYPRSQFVGVGYVF